MIDVPFQAKYGDNELIITADGKELRIPFTLKYGVNVVPFVYGGKTYDIKFVPRYGSTDINIPITIRDTIYLDNALGLSELNGEVFTIINQIPQASDVSTRREWIKHTLYNCGKKDGIYDKSSGQMVYKANTWTAYISDWQSYKKPLWVNDGYYTLSDVDKANYFTANVGDLLIFADIPDEAPATLQEFNALRDKYKYSGGVITGTEVYISYKSNGQPWNTNHIEVMKV